MSTKPEAERHKQITSENTELRNNNSPNSPDIEKSRRHGKTDASSDASPHAQKQPVNGQNELNPESLRGTPGEQLTSYSEESENNTNSPQPAAYWVERRRYLKAMKKIPELRRRYWKAALIYLLRRFLWSFTFFPVFITFWVPLVLSRFNPVAMVQNILPSLHSFVEANPEAQAATIETLVIAWFSIGFTFAVFDFILTPFKSPYEYEADVHMRAWEEMQQRNE